MNRYLVLSKEVEKALAEGKPVVALESTIISHGMPYPKNVETALRCEEIIRENGAVPATIGIIKGKLIAGLTNEEIDYMGKTSGILKVSRRDFPYVVAEELDGATTVASTMIIAEMAGIKVFATGGIGGVHRGGEETMDISADLEELSQTNVAVVCAGAKSILDIGLTLEYLETKGVPVYGYQTNELPAFYTRKSGFSVDYEIKDAAEMARVLSTKWNLGLKGGALIVNPIPEEYSMDEKLITDVINSAIKEAKENGIKGKETTPFLLSKVKDITKGDSLEANIQLAYHNALVAAQVAGEYKTLSSNQKEAHEFFM
ncbi:MAG: pseudouridine-5'-phosphate glycosidase, partial [Clostridium sp.]|nr:pseudouridine-5'-phosphate glycosidase [Clostridium sp.]